jgi:hypothetical protein
MHEESVGEEGDRGCCWVIVGIIREGASGAHPIDEVFQHGLLSVGSNGDDQLVVQLAWYLCWGTRMA